MACGNGRAPAPVRQNRRRRHAQCGNRTPVPPGHSGSGRQPSGARIIQSIPGGRTESGCAAAASGHGRRLRASEAKLDPVDGRIDVGPAVWASPTLAWVQLIKKLFRGLTKTIFSIESSRNLKLIIFFACDEHPNLFGFIHTNSFFWDVHEFP